MHSGSRRVKKRIAYVQRWLWIVEVHEINNKVFQWFEVVSAEREREKLKVRAWKTDQALNYFRQLIIAVNTSVYYSMTLRGAMLKWSPAYNSVAWLMTKIYKMWTHWINPLVGILVKGPVNFKQARAYRVPYRLF